MEQDRLNDDGRPRFSGTDAVHGGLIRTIVGWCDALGGAAALTDALQDLVLGLGADAGMIVRTNLQDGRPVRLATCDLAADRPGRRPLARSYADSYFGAPMLAALAATVWVGSAHAEDQTGDPALADWQEARGMHEFVVMVLSSAGATRDHLELHFRDRLTPAQDRALGAILPEMARVWSLRRVGMVTRSIVNHRSPAMRPQRSVLRQPILSMDNPAQLSRAEFRVCLLLSRGLLVQAVAEELSLSEATIRTHLRNIYAKTDCSCLAELVFRLMDTRPALAQPPEARRA